MIAFPNAKINLGLHVINKREDGFHNLETTFLSVNLCDILEVIESNPSVTGNNKVNFTSHGIPIDGDTSNNLVVRAYQLLDQPFNLPPVEICLYKKIPMGAGLGGGSSDAAFMIKLLNTKFNLQLSNEQLKRYAAKLGSDCAFFIDNTPAYVFGKGHELSPIEIKLAGYYLVLLCPPVHSSTALAYQNVSRRNEITIENSIKLNLQQPIETWRNSIFNDFEPLVFKQFPQLAQYKESLYQDGALYASMSGSGSSIFGIFKNKPTLPAELYKLIAFEGDL